MRQCFKYFVMITAFLGLMMVNVGKIMAVDDGDCECTETTTSGAAKRCDVISENKCNAGSATTDLVPQCIANKNGSCNNFIWGEGSCRCVISDPETEALLGTEDDKSPDYYKYASLEELQKANKSNKGLYQPKCDGVDGIKTALGCVPVGLNAFSTWAQGRLFPILALVCLALIIYGFIIIGTSEGDPKKLQLGKEIVISAISGLLIAIFGVFLIRFLLKDLIGLPGVQ